MDSGQTGKKPITTSRLGLDPAAKQERRREQNRIAQRAFRARAKIREQERVSLFFLFLSHLPRPPHPNINIYSTLAITTSHPSSRCTRISTNMTQSDEFDDDNQNEDVFDAR